MSETAVLWSMGLTFLVTLFAMSWGITKISGNKEPFAWLVVPLLVLALFLFFALSDIISGNMP